MIPWFSPFVGLFLANEISTKGPLTVQSFRRGNDPVKGKVAILTVRKETLRMQDRVTSSGNHPMESYDETVLLSMSKSCLDHIGTCGLKADWNEFNMVSKSAADLSSNEKIVIYQLFEDNMKVWYLKNWGLNVNEKKKELYHPDSRFICVHKSPIPGNTPSTKSSESDIKAADNISHGELIAFTMFRFEWDDEDEPEHPVLFCYEIQICDTFRGQKIGSKVRLSPQAMRFFPHKFMNFCRFLANYSLSVVSGSFY
jgi:hypothetical protein